MLLDLYEAKKQLKFQLSETTGDLKTDYFNSVDRTYTLQGHPDYAESNRKAIMENLVLFFQHVRFVDSHADLPIADDLGPKPEIPSQCHLVQIALFDDDAKTIYVLKSAWDRFDSQNQSTLVHHEIGGAFYRQMGELDSRPWRNVVAHIYAKEGQFLPVDHQIGETAQSFSTQPFQRETELYTISSFLSQKMYGLKEVRRLQFSQLFGRPMLAKTWVDIPYLQWEFKLHFVPGDEQEPPHVKCILQTPNIESEET